MPSKIQIITFLKDKNKIIIFWSILPAVLIIGQVFLLVLNLGVLPEQQQNKNTEPKILGASTAIRGVDAVELQTQIPILGEADLDKVVAKSFVVYDQSNGNQVLLKRSIDEQLSIASLTKLMTGLVAYQTLDFNRKIKIEDAGLTNIRPIVNFVNGEEVNVEDIFKAMIVGSTNDAAQILGNAIEQKTGKSMVALMNQTAKKLQMNSTSFDNAVGFDSEGNYSTAEDLIKLISETQKYSVFTNLGKTQSLQISGNLSFTYNVFSTNHLLNKYADLQAIKTGYTLGAQGAMAVKVIKDGHEIIILVLGSQNREQDVLLLKKMVVDRLEWR